MPNRRLSGGTLALVGVVAVVVVAGGLWAFARSSSSPTAVHSGTRPSSPTDRPPAGAGSSGGSQPTPGPPPTGTTTPRQPVTIAFAGDNNGEGLPAADMAQAMTARLAPMRDLLASADLTVANLETAITTGGARVAKQFTFRAPPSILSGLQAAGVDVASMANNHGMDYGRQGLADSLAAKMTSPIAVIGIGADDNEAFAPARVTIKGQRISVIAATQVLDDDLVEAWTATVGQPGLASAKRVDRLTAEVRRARADSDVVVVFLHWGVEKAACPSSSQQQLARALVDAGADVIVGGHAHRVQGAGHLGKAFVDYGLGNFGFPSNSSDAAHTGVLTVTVQRRQVQGYAWHPGLIRGATPYPLTGTAAKEAIDKWNDLRTCTGLSSAPS